MSFYKAFIDPGKKGGVAIFKIDTARKNYELCETYPLEWKKNKGAECMILSPINTFRFQECRDFFIEKQQTFGRHDTPKTSFGVGFYYGQLIKHIVSTGKNITAISISTWVKALKHETTFSPVSQKDTKKLSEYYVYNKLGEEKFNVFCVKGVKKMRPHDGIIDAVAMGLLFLEKKYTV